MNQNQKEYAPVTGFVKEDPSPDLFDGMKFYHVSVAKTAKNTRRVRIALRTAYKAVPRKSYKGKRIPPIKAFYGLVCKNCIFFDGNYNYTCRQDSFVMVDGVPVPNHMDTPVIIIDDASYRLVKKKGVKLLKSKLPYNYCPKCRIRMKRLDSTDGDPEGLRRDFECSRCGTVYGCTKAMLIRLRTKKEQAEHLRNLWG